ncbi:Hypothetical predicted protein, partial [Pelobates cultripes]
MQPASNGKKAHRSPSLGICRSATLAKHHRKTYSRETTPGTILAIQSVQWTIVPTVTPTGTHGIKVEVTQALWE